MHVRILPGRLDNNNYLFFFGYNSSMPRIEIQDGEVRSLLAKLSPALNRDMFDGVCGFCEARPTCAPQVLEVSKILQKGFTRHMVLEGRLMERGDKNCALAKLLR